MIFPCTVHLTLTFLWRIFDRRFPSNILISFLKFKILSQESKSDYFQTFQKGEKGLNPWWTTLDSGKPTPKLTILSSPLLCSVKSQYWKQLANKSLKKRRYQGRI